MQNLKCFGVTQNQSSGFGKAKLRVDVGAVLQHEATYRGRGDCTEEVAVRLEGIIITAPVNTGFRAPHIQISRCHGESVVEMIDGADLACVERLLGELRIASAKLIICPEPHDVHANHAVELFGESCLIGHLDVAGHAVTAEVEKLLIRIVPRWQGQISGDAKICARLPVCIGPDCCGDRQVTDAFTG